METDHDGNGAGDDLLGQTIHSFVVKIWREEAEQGKPPIWRGHITHVPSNARRYLKSLGDIPIFIKGYLDRMGVRVEFWWRMRGWLKRRKAV